MSAKQTLIVAIRLSKTQYLSYYQGKINQISALAEDGRRVQFPANILRKFVEHDGVRGRFKLSYSSAGKLISIERLTY